ncbi:MAG: hypothetical protein E6J41_01475 [Chloroflexi bacterium]|nr:MAG: hypothetical protein E6J41_01475 [Chloroflexota bacterium]
MAVDDRAGGTPAVTGGGLLGPLLVVVGGLLVAVSTLLPWVQITFALPNGQGTSERLGLQLTNGVLVGIIGVLTAVLGGSLAITRGSRAVGAWCVAGAAALAIAVTGGWWFRGYGTYVTGLGVVVCLVAAALTHPGPARQRVLLAVGATAAGAVAAVVLGLLVPYQTPAF